MSNMSQNGVQPNGVQVKTITPKCNTCFAPMKDQKALESTERICKALGINPGTLVWTCADCVELRIDNRKKERG